MSEKKYTILISAVACILVVVLTLCSCLSSYAQSFNDVSDADWKYVVAGNVQDLELNKGLQDTASKPFPANRPMDFVDVTRGKYSENVSYVNDQSDYFIGSNITLSSDSEIVLVIDFTHVYPGYQKGTLNVFVLSDSTVYFAKKGYWFDDDVWSYYSTEGNCKEDFTTYKYSDSDYYYVSLLNVWTSSSSSALEYAFMTGKMKVFSTADDAINYLETGDTSNMAWQGGTPKQEFDSGLLLNDFDVQFHDSNKFEECYLDVKYTIPEELKSVSSFQIDMEEQYDWCGHFSGSVSDWEESHTGTNYIDVLNHADGFRIYLKDVKAIDNFIDQYDGFFNATHKRQVLGSFTGLNIPFGDYLLGNVKVSCLDVKFHLVANKKYGHYVDYNLNLLTGIGVKNSYVPDIDGNYTSNNDSKVNGHYYTDVGTDAAGNTTYNYYYYYPDGGKEKVSSEDAANNTITNTVQEGAIKIDNSPTFNNNITVEGDTISNSANSYADSKSDATTNKSFIDKFLGFFDIIENNSFLGVFAKVFGWLPVGVSTLITTALGIIVGIRVFKFFK
nr:MAG TPA: hypothetical protein [Inoviridae sp.]